LALTPQNSDAFIREVDEELRRDQIFGFWRRYGRLVAALIGLGLVAFGGFLYWQQYRAKQAGLQGERLSAAIEQLSTNRTAAARPELDKLAASDSDGYRAAARIALAAVALQEGKIKDSAARFAAVAADASVAQPLRDLALVRQTTVEFDQLAPDTVVSRLQNLAVKGSPWFGSAGELVGAAHLKAGRPSQAARIFAAIGADSGVPESIRSRAVQITSVLNAGSPPASDRSTAK
jgi:hypothetical protein